MTLSKKAMAAKRRASAADAIAKASMRPRMATSPLPHIKSETMNASAYSIREAVIGFDDHGRMLFYYPEDVHLDDNEHPQLDHYRDIVAPAFPGEPEPILALKKYYGVLWLGNPYEWVGEWGGAEPTGSIAFTEEDALFLQETAEPGDLITRFRKR